MTTLSTKTYLQFVNDVIDEAGTDLATFATDGSDWLTQSDAMMNRFKKWVNRAWREIQQEANDWHWLDETAVITINPGIMFYSDTPITSATANINPLAIVDIDNSVYVSGLTVDGIHDLTGTVTGEVFSGKSFGYMDIRYSDYNPDAATQGHTLDFGLKAGGFKLTRDLTVQPSFVASFNGAEQMFYIANIAIGDAVPSLKILDPDTLIITTYPITNGVVQSKVQGAGYASIKVVADAVPDAFYEDLITMAGAASSESDFAIDFSVVVKNSLLVEDGELVLNGTLTLPNPSPTPSLPFIVSGAISPQNYKVSIDATSLYNVDNTTTDIKSYVFSYNNGGKFYTHTIPLLGTRTQIIQDPANTNSSVEFLIVEDLCLSASTGGTGDSVSTSATQPMSLFCTLLFMQLPSFVYNVDNLQFLSTPVNVTGVAPVVNVEVFSLTPPNHYTFSYPYLYLQNNYVHSWKSYDWGEESGIDDFVKNVRQTNRATFRIISREDPGVSREVPLTHIPWDEFQNKYDLASVPPSTPRIISEDNTGRYRLYPPPDRPYTIVFDYIREPQELSDYSDVCKGLPKEYEDAVMWRALQMYGEYDEQPADAARGRLNYKNMLMTMQQELRPAFHFRPRRLY